MEIINSFSPQIIIYAVLTALILIIALLGWIIRIQLSLGRLTKKNDQLFAGNKAKNLEEIILQQAQNIKSLDKEIQELYAISNQINNLAFRGLHKTGMVRFNPFKEVGGDQSFAIAMLNGKNNGLVISSLYTRDGTRIYAKSIVSGESEKHPLTEEEKESIKIALVSEPKKIN